MTTYIIAHENGRRGNAGVILAEVIEKQSKRSWKCYAIETRDHREWAERYETRSDWELGERNLYGSGLRLDLGRHSRLKTPETARKGLVYASDVLFVFEAQTVEKALEVFKLHTFLGEEVRTKLDEDLEVAILCDAADRAEVEYRELRKRLQKEMEEKLQSCNEARRDAHRKLSQKNDEIRKAVRLDHRDRFLQAVGDSLELGESAPFTFQRPEVEA